jgi:hypothetical protein
MINGMYGSSVKKDDNTESNRMHTCNLNEDDQKEALIVMVKSRAMMEPDGGAGGAVGAGGWGLDTNKERQDDRRKGKNHVTRNERRTTRCQTLTPPRMECRAFLETVPSNDKMPMLHI